MTDVEITIIGAGVIGLALAARFSKRYDNIIIQERHGQFGQETSSRNSEVVHSGIYYPTNSLKARLCVRGRKLLYPFCDAENIPYKKCGKLIVATLAEEIPQLETLRQKAMANGVHDLEFKSQSEIKELEPNIFALAALYSPSTGIIDSHAYMSCLSRQSESRGVEIVYQSTVTGIKKLNHNQGYRIEVESYDGDQYEYTSRMVFNCAGLQSDKIAELVGIQNPEYQLHYCKGEYFTVAPPKNKLVSRLIYPVPGNKLVGLGIHSTVDMGGGMKLGPNTQYLKGRDYDLEVTPEHTNAFYQAAKQFLPFLESDDLHPDQAGIRPKLQAEGAAVRDFIVQQEAERGLPKFVNLIGIESPGLTASLAIAERVDHLIHDN